jgi:serine/threonine protein phosphatase PrpC
MNARCETYAKSVTVLNGPDEKNLDAVYASSEQGIIAVFDGMSSNEMSRLASQKAVEMVRSELARLLLQKPERERMAEGLKNLFILIAAEIIREWNIRKIGKLIGTTGVMGKYFIDEVSGKPTVSCAHLGDSRMYRVRRGQLECLTLDYNDLIDELRLKPGSKESIFQWQDKIDRVSFVKDFSELLVELELCDQEQGVIRRWLKIGPGLTELITNRRENLCAPYVRHLKAEPGDEYIGVSDGISGNLHPDRFQEIVAAEKPIEEKGRSLILEAQEHPVGVHAGPDDMSVAILKPLL